MQYIFETIEKFQMIKPGMKVLVGVSGGADSVCLLYVMKEYQKQVPFELYAVHVEHGIRGQESLEDALFTENLCETMGIKCRKVSVPVPQIAREQGLSLEEAARKERYRIFEEMCREKRADRIAVAHNQNDQAETVLWNLVRGSGLKGLGGIRPVRGEIIRPLLFTDREKIEEILRTAGLTWRTDRTNLEQEYTRNRIRLSLLPQMERELNSQAARHMAQAAEKLQQVQDYVERMTDRAARECLTIYEDYETEERSWIRTEEWKNKSPETAFAGYDDRNGESDFGMVQLNLPLFFQQDELIRTELLKRALELAGGGLKDVGSVHLNMVSELAAMDCGKECHLPGGIRAVREDGVIRFFQWKRGRDDSGQKTIRNNKTGDFNLDENADNNQCGGTDILLPIPGELHLPGLRIKVALLRNVSVSSAADEYPEIVEEKKYTKWLSYDTINSNVRFRKRKTGDYLIVNDQGGRKKLKDYMIDCKIPRAMRDEIWLLADGSHILWVVGYRISEAAKVSEETEQVLKIQIEEEEK